MTSTDPIADMLSRIRNAVAANKNEVVLPHSRVKENIARILKNNRFIEDIKIEKSAPQNKLRVTIFSELNGPRITEIQRISRPGRRVYSGIDKIPTVKRGRGIVILSTSKGMMTGNEAKKARLGGELICKVY